MYCDLQSQYIQVRKLFKGGNYSRAETIRGNTVTIFSVTPNIQHYLQVFMLNENVIPRNQIEIVSKLSSGQFGYVYKGKSNTIRLSLNKNWTSQKWHSTCALINHLLNQKDLSSLEVFLVNWSFLPRFIQGLLESVVCGQFSSLVLDADN